MILRFSREDNGQGSLEYAMIIAFLALLLIGALTYFGNSLSESYTSSAKKLP